MHAGDARLALGTRRPAGPVRCDRAKASVGERGRIASQPATATAPSKPHPRPPTPDPTPDLTPRLPSRPIPQLALFCTLEIFSTLLSACVNAVLLLLYHLQCQALAPDALRDPGLDPSWLRCDSSAVGLGFSSALLLFLGLTASAALELRFRIQKTGKRSLNWNVKPQRWKERNIRRGASAALRALTKNEAGEDMVASMLKAPSWWCLSLPPRSPGPSN